MASFRSFSQTDIEISKLTGLETYKGLYYYWPELYSYISDPLVPTKYYVNLVANTVIATGYGFEKAGKEIRKNLEMLAKDEVPIDYEIIEPLLSSSYKVDNLNSTTTETLILVFFVVFLSFWVIWYLYQVGFWNHLFGNEGIACYECSSIFDRIRFLD
jgi:hypothetical protein